jgi:hypothetical protein
MKMKMTKEYVEKCLQSIQVNKRVCAPVESDSALSHHAAGQNDDFPASGLGLKAGKATREIAANLLAAMSEQCESMYRSNS